jgi:hypothetical protein
VPRTVKVETHDLATQKKYNARIMAWPAADPGSVPVHKVRELATAWMRALMTANQRMEAITPPGDRGLIPFVPTDVDRFVGQIVSYLDHYAAPCVMRAWEAAHHYVLDQWLSKSSRPTWDQAWQLPSFQTALGSGSALGAGSSSSRPAFGKYCMNWNGRINTKCNPNPADSCDKRHRCLVCDGDHPAAECSRRE